MTTQPRSGKARERAGFAFSLARFRQLIREAGPGFERLAMLQRPGPVP